MKSNSWKSNSWKTWGHNHLVPIDLFSLISVAESKLNPNFSAAEKCCSISVSCPPVYPQFSVGFLYPNGVCRCASMCAFLYWTISPQTVSLTQSLTPIINYPSSHCSLNDLFLNLFPLVSCHMLLLNSVFHLVLYSQNCIKEWQFKNKPSKSSTFRSIWDNKLLYK